MSEEPTRIINEQAQPVHLTLTKNTKGYQWEISAYGADLKQTLDIINAANDSLKSRYEIPQTGGSV